MSITNQQQNTLEGRKSPSIGDKMNEDSKMPLELAMILGRMEGKIDTSSIQLNELGSQVKDLRVEVKEVGQRQNLFESRVSILERAEARHANQEAIINNIQKDSMPRKEVEVMVDSFNSRVSTLEGWIRDYEAVEKGRTTTFQWLKAAVIFLITVMAAFGLSFAIVPSKKSDAPTPPPPAATPTPPPAPTPPAQEPPK